MRTCGEKFEIGNSNAEADSALINIFVMCELLSMLLLCKLFIVIVNISKLGVVNHLRQHSISIVFFFSRQELVCGRIGNGRIFRSLPILVTLCFLLSFC